jgi:hypothetical protein
MMRIKPMKYLVILQPTATGYSACSPDLDGCVAAGLESRSMDNTRRVIVPGWLGPLDRSEHQHGVAVAVEAVAGFDGGLVRGLQPFAAAQGLHEQ